MGPSSRNNSHIGTLLHPPGWYRWAAGRIAQGLGPPSGTRLLHVSDFHNRVSGFRLACALATALRPALVVNTGDLSGLGGLLERGLVGILGRMRPPQVLAPGNHDSALTIRLIRRMGAEVLDDPRLVTVGGVRVWGYPDPNRSPLFGPPYDDALCRAAARENLPPRDAVPFIIAVHNERMIERAPAGVTLVLSGHAHEPRVRERGRVVFVRPGSTGGGGPFGGPLRAAVVDLDLPAHAPRAVWLVAAHHRNTEVRPIDLT